MASHRFVKEMQKENIHYSKRVSLVMREKWYRFADEFYWFILFIFSANVIQKRNWFHGNKRSLCKKTNKSMKSSCFYPLDFMIKWVTLLFWWTVNYRKFICHNFNHFLNNNFFLSFKIPVFLVQISRSCKIRICTYICINIYKMKPWNGSVYDVFDHSPVRMHVDKLAHVYIIVANYF